MSTFTLQATDGHRPLRALLLFAALAAALAACGGGGGNAPIVPPVATPPIVTPPATELTLGAAGTDAVAGGAPLPLTASLNGTGTVGWALAAGSPGSLSAASGATVSYMPPAAAAVNAVTKVLVTATSGGLSKTLTLTLAPDPARPGLTLVAGNAGNNSANTWPKDGAGADARFSGIRGLGADAGGNIYVADYRFQNSRVRKISPAGVVTTVSNSSEHGHADGSLQQARFEDLTGLSVAADGTVYLNESRRNFVSSSVSSYTTWTRKLGPDGQVGTLASYGTALGSPGGGEALAGSGGTVYLWGGMRVSVLKADGSEQLLAGGSVGPGGPADVDGSGAAATFAVLRDVAVDRNGTLYALTSGAVRQITAAGVVTTLARLDPVPAGSNAPLAVQIGIDGNGNLLLLFVAGDQTSYEIRKLSGGVLSTLYTVGTPQGRYKTVAARMRVLADGAILIAGSHSVSRIGADGKAVVLAGLEDDTLQAVDGQGADARYVRPGLLAADQAGNVYSVEDPENFPRKAVIRKTTPSGAVSTYASADLSVRVTGMAVDAAGQLIVSVVPLDGAGGGIYRVGAGNNFTLLAGLPGVNANVPLQRDGDGAAARFGGPALAGIDGAGKLYVEDRMVKDNATTNVRMVTPQGAVSTIAALPAGLGAAPDGSRYQSDLQRAGIFRVAPDGSKTLVAGTPALGFQLGTELGALPGHLSLVGGIAVTGANSLAVASGSAILRLVLPPR